MPAPRGVRHYSHFGVTRAKAPEGEQLGTQSETLFWLEQREKDLEFQALLREHHPDLEGVCKSPGTVRPRSFPRPATKHANSSMGGNFDWAGIS